MGNNNSKLDPSDNKKDENKPNKKQASQPTIEININKLPEYTMKHVEKHKSKENGVWIVLHDLVYDVTPFLSTHPGIFSFN